MLTKIQKKSLIEEGGKRLQESETLVFAQFSGVSVESFKKLRRNLRAVGADVSVIKKRLLQIILQQAGVEFVTTNAKTQMATIFAKGDLSSVASIVHTFVKEIAKAKKGEFAIVGAFDLKEKRFVDAPEFKAIATLPSREVLLAQIAMMLTVPLKQIMTILNEKSKQVTQTP
ncbi:MAG: 50S ribosomal protein L10 [bacterium]|nr:50S ribosomal protein L10 [bacterium]